MKRTTARRLVGDLYRAFEVKKVKYYGNGAYNVTDLPPSEGEAYLETRAGRPA